MKTILVIFGGKSVEHDISVITALQAMKNIKGYEFLPVYIKPNGSMVTADNLTDEKIYLDYGGLVKNEKELFFSPARCEVFIVRKNKIVKSIKPYSALLCNHGHGGEDGSLQGMLEMCNIPYSSSSVLSSAIAMDKAFTKIILESNDVITPKYVHFNRCEYENMKEEVFGRIKEKIGFPCIVKPSNGGSSVGIGICTNEDMLDDKINDALNFDNKILVEEFIQNAREFSCAVLKAEGKNFASRVWQIEKGEFFTFDEKYLSYGGETKEQLTERLEKEIKELAKKCYAILECGGVVRVDVLMGEDGVMYVGELNSIPGSLAFNLFPYPFSDLISCLVEEGRSKMMREKDVDYSFSSSAIRKYIEFGDKIKKK